MNLLDTNVLSEIMKAKPEPKVIDWLDAQAAEDLFTSAVSQAEIELGLGLLPAGQRRDALMEAATAVFKVDLNGMVLPFDDGAAVRYGKLVARRQAARRPIAVEDAQIAAIALRHGLNVVTRNIDTGISKGTCKLGR